MMLSFIKGCIKPGRPKRLETQMRLSNAFRHGQDQANHPYGCLRSPDEASFSLYER